MRCSEGSGSLILALILGEMTAPPRYALTIVVAPTLAEKVRASLSPQSAATLPPPCLISRDFAF